MKTQGLPSPVHVHVPEKIQTDLAPPVHVHVLDKTHVHVHWMRNKNLRAKNRETHSKDEIGKPYHSVRSKSCSPRIPLEGASSKGNVSTTYKWHTSTQPFTPGPHGDPSRHADAELGHSHDKHCSKDRLTLDDLGGPHKNESQQWTKGVGRPQQIDSVSVRRPTSQAASKNRNIALDISEHHGDTELLLRTLVEAEIDGDSIARQLSALMDTVDSLPKDKRLSKTDVVSLGKQRDLLQEKIKLFDCTNRVLRDRLREWRDYEKDVLTNRLADSQAENIVLLAKLNSKEKETAELAGHLHCQRDNIMASTELSKTLNSTRSRLESQLFRTEAESSHLATQIQRMEHSLKAQQDELQMLRQQRRERERREWCDYEKDELAKRLADSEAENGVLLARLGNKEKEINELIGRLDLQKGSIRTTAEMSKTLQSTCNHLESQLRRKEAENSHLAALIQRMEAQQEELKTLKQQRQDRERLSMETVTVLKQQAEQANETVRQLSMELREKESQLAEAHSKSKDWHSRHTDHQTIRSHLEKELASLKPQLTELTTRLQAEEDKSRAYQEELTSSKSAQQQILGVKPELEKEIARLKTQVAELTTKLHAEEEKCKANGEELAQRSSSLDAITAKSEAEIARLKTQVTDLTTKLHVEEEKCRVYREELTQRSFSADAASARAPAGGSIPQTTSQDSEEYSLRLENVQREAQKEAREVKAHLEGEIKKLRGSLLEYLETLEKLAEKQKVTETQLKETQAQALTAQQHNCQLQEENNLLKDDIERLEMKLERITSDGKDKAPEIPVKETTTPVQQPVHSARQDSASQTDGTKGTAKTGIAKTDLTQLLKNKEDMEANFQSQLKAMRERLEESESTNRSLQNILDTLKSEYGTLFDYVLQS